jgi:hypothetical protein
MKSLKTATVSLCASGLLTCLFSGAAFATSDFFQCEQTIPDKTACRIKDNDLLHLTSAEAFEQEFSVVYTFSCRGHNEPLVIESDSEAVLLPRGPQPQVVTLRGTTSLKLRAQNERSFYRASFDSNCDVNIQTVSGSPSSNTLVLWNTEALGQAKIITLSKEFYLVANSMDAYQNYNKGKFNLLKEKLEFLVDSDPENIDYKLLLTTVNAGLSGDIIPYTPEEIRQSGETLSLWAKTQMLNNRDEGVRQLARFKKYNQQLNEQLNNAVAKVTQ